MKKVFFEAVNRGSSLGVSQVIFQPDQPILLMKDQEIFDNLPGFSVFQFRALMELLLNRLELQLFQEKGVLEKLIPFSGKMIPLLVEGQSLSGSPNEIILGNFNFLSLRVLLNRNEHFNSLPLNQKFQKDLPEPLSLNDEGFDKLLKYLQEQGGSDIYLIEGKHPWVKINEDLYKMKRFGIVPRELLFNFYQGMGIQKPEEALGRDADFLFADDFEGSGRFRLRAFEKGGEFNLFFRRIPNQAPKLQELGHLIYFSPILEGLQRGLILIGAPSGAGRTTTTASLVRHLLEKDPTAGALIFENPVEYTLQEFGHRVSHSSLDLRDQNVPEIMKRITAGHKKILVFPEIFVPSIAALAVKAAQQGYICISVLEGATIPELLEKLDNLFPAQKKSELRRLLASNFKAACCQRIVPRAMGRGVVAIIEFLHTNQAVENILFQGKFEQLNSVMELGGGKKMITLKAHLEKLKVEGIVHKSQFLT